MAHTENEAIRVPLRPPPATTDLMLADLEGFTGHAFRSRSDAPTRKALRSRGLVVKLNGKDYLTVAGYAALDVASLVRGIYRRRIEQLEELERARERAAIDAEAIGATESLLDA